MNKSILFAILLAIILFLGYMLIKTSNKIKNSNDEIRRIENNMKATNDTLKNYKLSNGFIEAEMLTLYLELEELQDSLIDINNRKPKVKIEYQTKIVEKIVNVPVKIIENDTVYFTDRSIANVSSEEKWGNSYRKIGVNIPYEIIKDSVIFGNSYINLEQNVWIESKISQDPITKELYLNLKTDYPNVTFTNGSSVLLKHKDKKKDIIGIGLSAGFAISKSGYSPYFGIGVNYTPKILQR